MQNIILSQSHDNFRQLVLFVAFTAVFTLIFAHVAASMIKYYFVEDHFWFIEDILKEVVVPIIAAIISAGLCCWSIYSIAAQMVESDKVCRSTGKIAYYQLKKDGSLIVAEKKSDAPDWLADSVETKIISENKSTYQIQFKDQFARIEKKNVE